MQEAGIAVTTVLLPSLDVKEKAVELTKSDNFMTIVGLADCLRKAVSLAYAPSLCAPVSAHDVVADVLGDIVDNAITIAKRKIKGKDESKSKIARRKLKSLIAKYMQMKGILFYPL